MVTWASGVPAEDLYRSAITVLELETGVLLVSVAIPIKVRCSGPGWTWVSYRSICLFQNRSIKCSSP